MKLKEISLLASLLGFVVIAQASPVVLTGSYIKTAVNDQGTLGSNNTTSPGLLYDKTGTSDFSANNDYLTPGTPYDYFGIKTNQTGLVGNGNSFINNPITSSLGAIDTSSGTTKSASWTGEYGSFFKLVNEYKFANDGQRIDVKTTITAIADLTGVQFARSIDPDPDVNTFGNYDTVNSLGNATLGLAATDWAYSLGLSTGLPLGLFTNSSFKHNAGIAASWGEIGNSAADPTQILAGINDGNGDYALALGFDIGSILSGSSVSFDYAYVMGLSKDVVDVPIDPNAVPVPGAVWLFGTAIAGFMGFGRKKLV